MSEIFKIILSFFHNRNEGKMFVHPVTHDAHGLVLKKRIRRSRILRLRQVAQATFFHSAAVRSARSIFIVWKRRFLYDKNALCRKRPKAQDLVFLFYWQALQLHQHEHIVDRANGVFEIPVAHADDDV